MRTCAISRVIDCSAFGGRFGLGAETWYLQSSATTDARIETHLDSSSGAAILASLVCDAERERDRELLLAWELRLRRLRGLSYELVFPKAFKASALHE